MEGLEARRGAARLGGCVASLLASPVLGHDLCTSNQGYYLLLSSVIIRFRRTNILTWASALQHPPIHHSSTELQTSHTADGGDLGQPIPEQLGPFFSPYLPTYLLLPAQVSSHSSTTRQRHIVLLFDWPTRSGVSLQWSMLMEGPQCTITSRVVSRSDLARRSHHRVGVDQQ